MNGSMATRQLRSGLPYLIEDCRGRKATVRLMVVEQRQSDLLEVVDALDASERLSCGGCGGRKQTDHHQEGAQCGSRLRKPPPSESPLARRSRVQADQAENERRNEGVHNRVKREESE